MKDNWLLILLIGAGILYFASRRSNNGGAVNNISNAEVWKWVDYKGHERQITITRDVHVS